MKDAEGEVVATIKNTDGDGTAALLKEFTFDKPGTYVYTVTESLPEGTTLPGVANGTTEYTVTFEVTDNGDGTLSLAIEGSDEDAVVIDDDNAKATVNFVNTYSVGSVDASFPVKKEVTIPEGKTGPEEWEYTINVDVAEDSPTGTPVGDPMSGTVSNENPVTEFGPFTYNAPGTYIYTVTETGDIDGVTNEQDADGNPVVKTVTVTVTDNGDGTLSATPSSTAQTTLTFTNTYDAEPIEVPIEANKSLVGRKLKAEEFEFTLTGDGDVSKTAKNDDDGKVEFGTFEYDSVGTYTYTIKETKGELPRVEYDEGTVTATVKVTDDGHGKLKAEVVYTKGEEKTNTFVNKYTPEDDEVNIGVEKKLNVDTEKFTKKLEAGEFEFELKLKSVEYPAETPAEEPE